MALLVLFLGELGPRWPVGVGWAALWGVVAWNARPAPRARARGTPGGTESGVVGLMLGLALLALLLAAVARLDLDAAGSRGASYGVLLLCLGLLHLMLRRDVTRAGVAFAGMGLVTGAPAGARTARPGARVAGAVLCTAGLAFLCLRSLLGAAVGLEAVAMAFWVWARAAEDAEAQAPRWAWLRRPAAALWLAVAIHAVWPWLSHGRGPVRDGMLAPLRWLEAGAVLWAGLELLAGLPLARPYSDLPGPLLAMRPWLPVMLPAAGFMVLWRQSPHWLGISPVRHTATVL